MSKLYLYCMDCGEKHTATAKHFPKVFHKKVYNHDLGETKKVAAGYRCKKCCLRKDRKGLNQTRKEQKISFRESLQKAAEKLTKKSNKKGA